MRVALLTIVVPLLLGGCGVEQCPAAGTCASGAADDQLTVKQNGTTVHYPQGFRVEVAAAVHADYSVDQVAVSNPRVTALTPGGKWVNRFQAVQAGSSMVTVPASGYHVTVVVHSWPFAQGDFNHVPNVFNPGQSVVRRGDDIGIELYESAGGREGPWTVTSDNAAVIAIADSFVTRRSSGYWDYTLLHASSTGSAVVNSARATESYDHTVSVRG